MCIKAGPLEICNLETSFHSLLRYNFAIISHYIAVKLNYIWKGAVHDEVDLVAHHRVSDKNFFPKVFNCSIIITIVTSVITITDILTEILFKYVCIF